MNGKNHNKHLIEAMMEKDLFGYLIRCPKSCLIITYIICFCSKQFLVWVEKKFWFWSKNYWFWLKIFGFGKKILVLVKKFLV